MATAAAAVAAATAAAVDHQRPQPLMAADVRWDLSIDNSKNYGTLSALWTFSIFGNFQSFNRFGTVLDLCA